MSGSQLRRRSTIDVAQKSAVHNAITTAGLAGGSSREEEVVSGIASPMEFDRVAENKMSTGCSDG